MEIEFFHNSVCSYCYIQSRRLQEILKDFPEATVKHRSFPLNLHSEDPKSSVNAQEREDVVAMWKRANRVDEEKRFNVEALESGAEFVKPTSYMAEKALKAASKVSDERTLWALSDAIQKAYFENLLDISDINVLESIIQSFDIDLEAWREAFQDASLDEEMNRDFHRAESFDIDYIPALVVNGESVIKGALRTQLVQEKLNNIRQS